MIDYSHENRLVKAEMMMMRLCSQRMANDYKNEQQLCLFLWLNLHIYPRHFSRYVGRVLWHVRVVESGCDNSW